MVQLAGRVSDCLNPLEKGKIPSCYVLDLIKKFQIRFRRNKYRRGAVFTRFVACDIRRDIEVVDASEIDNGYITAKSRTWNVLYAIKGIAAKPEFGEPERLAIAELWKWEGPSWGGPVNDEGPRKKEA